MPSFEHQGHTVTVNDRFTFTVTGPEFEDSSPNYDTAQDARNAIERRIKTAEKQEQAVRRVSLAGFDKYGTRVTVTGVNRTTGAVLGIVTESRHSRGDWYPNSPAVPGMIARRQRLAKALELLDDRLTKIGITLSPAYGRVEPHKYDAALKIIEDRYVDAKAAADRIDPAEFAPASEGDASCVPIAAMAMQAEG